MVNSSIDLEEIGSSTLPYLYTVVASASIEVEELFL